MNTLFPFGLPGPTAWYETLYVLTFALHQSLMHYVLAGSLVVAWAMLLPGRGPLPRWELPAIAVVRDWAPFLLSAAITAGVAPLLFVQILYPQQFYTANLLLSWRWMIVIPVLIVVFYLLYVLKMDFLAKSTWALRSLVAATVAIGVVFVGFCWTANYLLSTDEAAWPDVYLTGRMPFAPTSVILRMLVWIGGSLVSLATIVSWQIGPTTSDKPVAAESQSARLLGWIALIGIDVFLLSGLAALWQAAPMTRHLVWSNVGRPYLIVLAVDLAIMYAAWFIMWRRRRLSRPLMVVSLITWIVALVAVSALREVGRMAAVDVLALAPEHAAAAKVGGLGVFLAFAVINGLAITWCVWIVRRKPAKA